MTASPSTVPLGIVKTPPSVSERLKFAHFCALGLTQVAQQVGISENGQLEIMLERILMDVFFKTSIRLRKESRVQFWQATLSNREMPKGFRGNFGFLYFLRNNSIEWGRSRVGASTEATKWLKNGVRYDPIPITGQDIPTAYFSGLPGKHKHSEYWLINALGNFIQSQGFQTKVGGNVTGHVILFTELSPCESCTLVIEQFLEKYAGITLTVCYALEYTYDPEVLKRILAARRGSTLRQFDSRAAQNMHWERKR